jgi:sulfur carrier protein ThiS
MGTVKIRAEGGIARFVPGNRGDLEAELRAGDRVGDVLARIGVPANAVALILLNDRVAGPGDALSAGDVMLLLPLIVGG